VWPGVRKECRAWASASTPCQQSKVTRHVKAPLRIFDLPSARFSHMHIDLIGPLPVSSGFRYCLTAIDSYARWPEALPLFDITAEVVAKAFVSVWIARFGCPQQITTDQGRQFEARLFKTLATITGSSLTRTTAWHPASNNMIHSRNHTFIIRRIERYMIKNVYCLQAKCLFPCPILIKFSP